MTHAERAENLARKFHETYERLAPQVGYETRKESAVKWDKVPERNKILMIATCMEILEDLDAAHGPAGGETPDAAHVRELVEAARMIEPMLGRYVDGHTDKCNSFDCATHNAYERFVNALRVFPAPDPRGGQVRP